MPGSSFGTLAITTRRKILKIIENNPCESSRELAQTIETKAKRTLSVRQVANIRKRLGQHKKKRQANTTTTQPKITICGGHMLAIPTKGENKDKGEDDDI